VLSKQLELEPALLAYQRALDSNHLTYEELVELLKERALLLHGLKRLLERDADLEWLCAIAPDADLGMRAPPELAEALREIRGHRKGVLEVKLRYELTNSLEAHAKLLRAPSLGARTRIWIRETNGAWRGELTDTLWQVAIAGQRLELYAEALAPGGVVVAHDYSVQAPLRILVGESRPAVPAPLPVVPLQEPHRDHEERWGKRHRGWLIAGGVVVVAAAAVAGVLLWKDHKDSERDQDQGKTTVTPAIQF
jgi:hypothetical protein